MSRSGVVPKAVRHIRQLLRSKLYYGFLHGVLLRSRARAKHRALLQRAQRSDSHTYTSFYRSPAQLAALTGPVIDYLAASGDTTISINVLAASNGAEAYTVASELLARRPEVRVSIQASDLHDQMVERGTAAVYTMDEITQGLHVPTEFIERTFDKVGNLYAVKPEIRSRVTFVQADLLDPQLNQRFEPADLVIAQNVLFHMPSDLAHRAFANIVSLLKPHGVLFLDGMELDMRVELTKGAKLTPLRYKIKDIYEYSRRHIPENWWEYYYGNEPYFPFSRERSRRYGTIFLNE
jgi:chemotaxis protein methyltransferase CheR